MANPKAAVTTTKGRTYGLDLPEPTGHVNLWSVTTIIDGGLPKPALVGWGIKSVAEYAAANYKRLYQMASAADGDEDALDGVVRWLKGSPYRAATKKADLGTLLHEIAEAKALQKPLPTITPEVAPLYQNYLRFVAEYGPELEMSEATVYSVKESFAGTLDGIGRLTGKRVPAEIRGKLVLIDYKTGGEIYPTGECKGVYAEAALQMGAYAHAEGVYLAPGTIAPMPQVEAALAVHITAQGYHLHPVQIDEPVWRAFRYVRESFRFVEELSKVVIGTPVVLAPAVAAKRTRKAAA